MTTGYREFEFDLPDALLTGIIARFDAMEGASLTHENLDGIPDAQGVYQLLLADEIVYIGKTDAEAGLRQRLSRHAWTIQHRRNLNVPDVQFKAMRVFVFTAVDLETQLIHHYRKNRLVNWNNSGFGSNDPGRNRDQTRAKPTSFDVLYPIDLDQEIKLGLTGTVSVVEALQCLRNALPYTLRIEALPRGASSGHADMQELTVHIPNELSSAGGLLSRVVAALPGGWQATALAGRIILYKERAEYPSGTVIARSS
jgi:hypothetical protein